jgi:hypothetical protein
MGTGVDSLQEEGFDTIIITDIVAGCKVHGAVDKDNNVRNIWKK